MSLSVLRAPIRRAVLAAPFPKTRPYAPFRRYSTPPQGKSNFGLFAGLGIAALGGVGYYLYSTNTDAVTEATGALKSVGKAKAGFKPTQDDYQKVRSVYVVLGSSTYRDGH
jgi:cytochrome c peroxidase